MNNQIIIPTAIAEKVHAHFFQNEVEQGAFLFAEAVQDEFSLDLVVSDFYLVPSRAWEVQMNIYLQMKDSERANIMKMAREKKLCTIDCHSHPSSQDDVWFSPSDILGITEFAQYAKWKLNSKPFAAMVWGEASMDAVVWQGEFTAAEAVTDIRITGATPRTLTPTGSWFYGSRGKHRFYLDE